jgi:DNA-directed RNA polymerase II subunit RPB2
MAGNYVYVFAKAAPSAYTHLAEIRSAVEQGGKTVSTMQVKIFKQGNIEKTVRRSCSSAQIDALTLAQGGTIGQVIRTSLPYIREDIPIVIVFRALGIVNDREILNHICYNPNDTELFEMLKPSLEEAFPVQDQDVRRGSPSEWNGRTDARAGRPRSHRPTRQRRGHQPRPTSPVRPRHLAKGDVAPRLDAARIRAEEGLFLRLHDPSPASGRARTERAGRPRSLWSQAPRPRRAPSLFPLPPALPQAHQRRLQEYAASASCLVCPLSREADALAQCIEANKTFKLGTAIKSHTITHGLRYSLSTGNWGDAKKAMQAKAGVSQVLNRYTYASTLSHLRRCNTPIGRDGKIAKPRQLHNTHWGMVCPAETPEGQACGLVKNLALMAYISVGSSSAPVIHFLEVRSAPKA